MKPNKIKINRMKQGDGGANSCTNKYVTMALAQTSFLYGVEPQTIEHTQRGRTEQLVTLMDVGAVTHYETLVK